MQTSASSAMWTPAKPSVRALSQTGMRLPPLEGALGTLPLPRSETSSLPKEIAPATCSRTRLPWRPPRPPVASRPGHVGILSSLRRSTPEQLPPAVLLEALGGSARAAPRPEVPDVLRRRPQRGHSRGRRALDAASEDISKPSFAVLEAGSAGEEAIKNAHGSSIRSASAPPAGAEEAARMKARAVAQLQRLFFEEVSKGLDANEAAAAALRRIKEGPLASTATASVTSAESCQGSEGEDDTPLRPFDPFREEREAAAQVRVTSAASSIDSPNDEADAESIPEPAAASIPHRPSPAIPRPTRRRPVPRHTAVHS